MLSTKFMNMDVEITEASKLAVKGLGGCEQRNELQVQDESCILLNVC